MDSQPINDPKSTDSEKMNAEEIAKEIVSNVQSTVLAEIEAKSQNIDQSLPKTENVSETILETASKNVENLFSSSGLPEIPAIKPDSIDFAPLGDFKSNESSPYSDEKEQSSEESPEDFKQFSESTKTVNPNPSLDTHEDSSLDKAKNLDLLSFGGDNVSTKYSEEKRQSNEESPEEFKDISGLLEQVNAQASLDTLEDFSYDKVKNLNFPPVGGDYVPPKMPGLESYFGDPMTASIVDYTKLDDDIKMGDSPVKETSEVEDIVKEKNDKDKFERDFDEFEITTEPSFLSEEFPECPNMDDTNASLFNQSSDTFNAENNDVLNSTELNEFKDQVIDEESMSFGSNKTDDGDDIDKSGSTLNMSGDKNLSGIIDDLPIEASFRSYAQEAADEFISITDTPDENAIVDIQSKDKPTNISPLIDESENIVMETFNAKVSTLQETVNEFDSLSNPSSNVAFDKPLPVTEESVNDMENVLGDNVVQAVDSITNKFDMNPSPVLEHKTASNTTVLNDVVQEESSKPDYTATVATATAGIAAVGGALAAMSFIPSSPSSVDASKADAKTEEAFKNVEPTQTGSAMESLSSSTTTLPFLDSMHESHKYFEPVVQALSSEKKEEPVQNRKTEEPTMSSFEKATVSKATELSQFEVQPPQSKIEPVSAQEQPTAQQPFTEQTKQTPPATSERSTSVTKHLASIDATSAKDSYNKDNKLSTFSSEQEPQNKTIMGRKNSNRRENSQESVSSTDHVAEYIHNTFGSNAAELIYWRDAKASGIVFGAGLIILFSLTCYSVISVVSNTLMLAVIAGLGARIYTYVQQTLKKTEVNHPFKEYLDFEFNPSKERTQEIVDQLLSQISHFVNKMRAVLLVEDIVVSIKYLIVFWLFTYMGAWFNGMTLIILSFIAAFSIPKVYENNKSQIDFYLDSINGKIEEFTSKVPFLKKAEVEKED